MCREREITESNSLFKPGSSQEETRGHYNDYLENNDFGKYAYTFLQAQRPQTKNIPNSHKAFSQLVYHPHFRFPFNQYIPDSPRQHIENRKIPTEPTTSITQKTRTREMDRPGQRDREPHSKEGKETTENGKE